MDTIANFPYGEIQFTKHGEVFVQTEVDSLVTHVSQNAVTDLILVSHGWKNDIADARDLYTRLLTSLSESSEDLLDNRTVAVAGLFWPSKKYTPMELQPGGGASIEDPEFDAGLHADLESLAELCDDESFAATEIARLQDLLPFLEDSRSKRDDFVASVMRLLFDNIDLSKDPEVQSEIPESIPDVINGTGEDDLLDLLGRPGVGEGGNAGGGAAGLGAIWNGLKGGVANFLNITTYWKMKLRAGLAGMNGLRQVLLEIQAAAPEIRIHLVGHSFGGRVVSAALRNHGGETPKVASMTLLQAAFSHYGFASGDATVPQGFFASVVADQRVAGPIAITHTKNDKAVGVAYPLASRMNRDNASGFGDADDQFGAIGSNGALKSQARARVMSLFAPGENSPAENTLEATFIHNFKADDCIADHGDVANTHVGRLLAEVIDSTN